jgi:AraC-like DNA-binding protein
MVPVGTLKTSVAMLESYLLVSVILLVLITLIEVLIMFKAKSLLKSIFLMLLSSVGLFMLARFLTLFGYSNRLLMQIPPPLIFVSVLFLLSFLNHYEISKKTVVFSLFILVLNWGILAYFSLILDYPNEVIMANVPEFSNYLYIVRIIVTLLILILTLNFIQKIYRKYPSGNLYFRKLRTWSISFPILLIIIFCFSLTIFYSDNAFIRIRLFIVSFPFATLILLILFRPRFLNHLSLELLLKNPSANSQYFISDSDFMDSFFGKAYFLNPLASLDDMAYKFGISGTELYNYIYSRYTLSFNDLLNKHRVEYFIELVQARKYPHYTIDALAQLSGFSSRHHLYKPFQKFHGGTPSSFMNSIS